MRPSASFKNRVNVTGCNSKLLRELQFADTALCVQLPYLANLYVGEFMIRLPLSLSAILLCHILKIVCLRAKKQMVGIDAGADIAVMADKQACGDGTVSKFPSGSVSGNVVSKMTATANHAITIRGRRALPQNAAIRIGRRKMWREAFEQCFSGRTGTGFKVAICATEIPFSFRELGAFLEKIFTASLASADGFAVRVPALATAEMHSSARSYETAIPREDRFAIRALKLDFSRLAISHGASLQVLWSEPHGCCESFVRFAYFTTAFALSTYKFSL